MNNYCRLSRAKEELALTVGTLADAALVRTIASVSRAFDEYLKPRHFYTAIESLYFDGNDCGELWLNSRGDILSVTSLAFDEDGDGTFELALTEAADFVLWPYNQPQKWRADLLGSSGQRVAFTGGQRRVKVVAKTGYSEDTEPAGTLGAAITGTTDTSVTLAAGHTVELGDTLLIGSEQLYVSALAEVTATVVRGVNGTTAATALNGATVSARRYPDDIEHAVIMQLTRYRWDQQTGLAGAMGMGGEPGKISLWPQVRGILQGYDLVSPFVGAL